MAKNKSSQSSEETTLEIEQTENSDTSENVASSQTEEKAPEVTEPSKEGDGDESPHQPAVVALQTSKDEAVKPARSHEEIAAAMHEKLSRKTDKDGLDPFVPSSQVENEVKQIATNKGFPLSRGTEIGARLMARSKRSI